MKKFLFYLPILLLPLGLHAQLDLSSSLLRGTWQANKTNPALLPDQPLTIGLGGIYNHLVITNITYNDLVVQNTNGEDVLDINAAINKLEDQNQVREQLHFETIGLAVQLGKLNISLSHALKFNAFVDYPKTLPQLIWQGNSQFIGQEVAFGPDLQLHGYHEIALGLGFQLNDQITIGGRAKYLNGFGDISTDRTDLRLLTQDDIYQLQLQGDYRVNTAGSLQYDGFSDLTLDFNFGSFNQDGLPAGNGGLAFDVGAHLKFNKLDVAVSILDIGQINWDESVQNYSVDEVYEFGGLDVAQDILDDTSSFNSTLDTLETLYEVKQSSNSYSTTLPMTIFLSAAYQLNDRLRLGAVFQSEEYRAQNQIAFLVGANYQIISAVNVGGTLGYQQLTESMQLGLNTTLKLGPVQVVAATDNILTAFNILDSHAANVRVGLNLVFGRNKATHFNDIENQEDFFRK